MKKNSTLLFLFLTYFISLDAQISLPKIFSDNMVLQRNKLIPIWGKAQPNESLEVRFNRQSKNIKANSNGDWSIKLDAELAGGPFPLQIFGKDTLTFKNVLVGEVWLCSGQSNMEWMVGQAQDAAKEIEEARYPFIRHIKIDRNINTVPENDVKTNAWKQCNFSTVNEFTAVGYFFAKNLFNELKVPIGLIHSSWGGTNIETWISREGFESSDEYKEMISKLPKIKLDSIEKIQSAANLERIEALQGAKLTSNTEKFKDIDFNDTLWFELNQPQIWEEQSLVDFDGVVWLRKTFSLSEAQSKQKATLLLSKIDDNDITYINGVKVGSTNQWDAARNYPIPAGILKEGKNVIAVKVTDTGGGGGIYGDANDLQLKLESSNIPLNGKWKCQVESIKRNINENSLPSLCYNAMIAPLLPYAIQGVLWYQGESNAGRAAQYIKAFPLLINDWRTKFQQGNFPFYFVQLSTFKTTGNSNEGCGWAELREAQTQTLSVPNTGMCVTTDVGNPNDIHPINKQTVGARLAAMALNNLYERPRVCNSPLFKNMSIKGNQAILSFENIGSGLQVNDKYGYIKGFEIAGKNQVFYFAKAYIKDNNIIVENDNVKKPLAIRYGWMGDASECNVFNKEGFPLSPFRTNNWKSTTTNTKYGIIIK